MKKKGKKDKSKKEKKSWWPSPVDHDQRDQLFVVLSAAFGIRWAEKKWGE
jgi:hypothetical protein